MTITPYNKAINVCQADLLPIRLAGLIQRVLVEYFSDAANIQAPSLQQYVYGDDPLVSGIRIEQAYKWDPRIADKAPAIIIKPGGAKSSLPLLNSGEYVVDNKPTTVAGWTAEVGVICISRLPAEAEQLASEVTRLLTSYQRNIIQYLRLTDMSVTGFEHTTSLPESALFAALVGVVCRFVDIAIGEPQALPRIVISVK